MWGGRIDRLLETTIQARYLADRCRMQAIHSHFIIGPVGDERGALPFVRTDRCQARRRMAVLRRSGSCATLAARRPAGERMVQD